MRAAAPLSHLIFVLLTAPGIKITMDGTSLILIQGVIIMNKLTNNIFPLGQRGQEVMEYVIIVAMIAVAAIGVDSVFGQNIRNQSLANEVAGKPAEAQIQAAGTTAQNAATRANPKKGVSEDNKDNDAGRE